MKVSQKYNLSNIEESQIKTKKKEKHSFNLDFKTCKKIFFYTADAPRRCWSTFLPVVGQSFSFPPPVHQQGTTLDSVGVAGKIKAAPTSYPSLFNNHFFSLRLLITLTHRVLWYQPILINGTHTQSVTSYIEKQHKEGGWGFKRIQKTLICNMSRLSWAPQVYQ